MALFSRTELIEALQELSRELRFKGVRAHIYVIGAAAISLCFDARRTTMDVDALILEGHGPIVDAVRRIARKRGWPESWLNEQAVSAIPKTRDGLARTAYSDANLVVTSASTKHLLAIKIRAGRKKDLGDITLLVNHLGLRSIEEVVAVHDQVFPGDPLIGGLKPRVEQHLASLWLANGALEAPVKPAHAEEGRKGPSH